MAKNNDGSIEPDYRSVLLRKIWEKVCLPMGYPDPRKEARRYHSTTVPIIDSRRSNTDLQLEASKLGLGRVQIRTKKVQPRRISVIPYAKFLFTDLKQADPQEDHIQLQYGVRKINDGDISVQSYGEPVHMFKEGDPVHVVTDANLAMYLDLCGQCADSPAYMDEKQQSALGFRLELLTPIKGTARLFKTIGFEKTTQAPVKLKTDNTKLIEAQITLAGHTRIVELCRGFGIEPRGMRDQDMKAALYSKATEPSNHALFMEMLAANRVECENDVTAAHKAGLLVFKDFQWYVKDDKDQLQRPALLNGTMMADCSDDEGNAAIDAAKVRLVNLMVGSVDAAPRTDITKEIRRVLNKEFLRHEVFEKVAVATGRESDYEIATKIAELVSDGEIYYNKKGKCWSWGANDSTIITVKDDQGTNFEQLRKYITLKGLDWVNKALEKHTKDAAVVK